MDSGKESLNSSASPSPRTLLERFILLCIERKSIVLLFLLMLIAFGAVTAPFNWNASWLYRDPVPVDAVPDIGENQQIVFTEWPGRSPQDVEDQVTYPLTISLLGLPGVKSVRSNSAFGFSSVYVIFEDDVDFYWARSRILEKLNSLPEDLLADGVKPQLGPDATALGQIFWYTLEGRDPEGRLTGGWDPQELRSLQDWYVRFALLAVDGVAEVASVGGFIREYQVDVDPVLLQAYGLSISDVARAVSRSNQDVGARTLEINKVEYLVRGLGYIKSLDDLRYAVIATRDNQPIFVEQLAHVTLGPAQRIGALDKNGQEAVGGVVTVQHGRNPLEVINDVKRKISEISPGLPEKTLLDGVKSKIEIVPFYDRSELIQETLDTLQTALTDEILVTVLIIIVAVLHLGGALLVSAVLPLSVLACFIAMKVFGVDANIVALAGIAIAIGTMVDMGIILTENIQQHSETAEGTGKRSIEIVFNATKEAAPAIITAISTTVISFLPVFAMGQAEGKLFRPLAFTKTFTLSASLIVALIIIPPAAHLVFGDGGKKHGRSLLLFYEVGLYAGLVMIFTVDPLIGGLLAVLAAFKIAEHRLPDRYVKATPFPLNRSLIGNIPIIVGAVILVSLHWRPLGPGGGYLANTAFVVLTLGGWLLLFKAFHSFYPAILGWFLRHKVLFMVLPLTMLFTGVSTWIGFDAVSKLGPEFMRESRPARFLAKAFPGLGKEFMPPLDEGSFLYMPSTMPHASIGEVKDIIRKQDLAISAIPEVESAVGKIGRADTPLDPAPVSMIETVINYKQEYLTDENGDMPRFAYDPDAVDLARNVEGRPAPANDGKGYHVRGKYTRDELGRLIPDPDGKPFRQWRPPLDPAINPGREAWEGVRTPSDIWEAVVRATDDIPGTTTASELQPISARLVMLQSGIRASTAVKVIGPDLASIQKVSNEIESMLRKVPSIAPGTVVADRVVAKPYLEIEIDRRKVAQYGFDVQDVQDVIETAIGGKLITTTVEGRERYPVRVRYMRELRDDFDELERILVSRPDGFEAPIGQLVNFNHVRGPSVIKTEDSFLVGYVLFDKARGYTEVQAVRDARKFLETGVSAGLIELPRGVSFNFTGNFENQQRAEKRLMLVLPLTLALIFLILQLKFGRLSTTLTVFSGVIIAWSGGFIMLWLYGRPWFMDFSLFGADMRELFQIGPIHLSIAVWVGFLALFGIATDDGVIMASYLDQSFAGGTPESIADIRRATIEAGMRRVRPCLMTTATTLLALLPVLTSTGRGSDILAPMAIPTFGGMVFAMITMFMVPVIYCWMAERRLARDALE